MTLKEDAWIATACGLAMTMLVQGPSAVSARIRETRKDDGAVDCRASLAMTAKNSSRLCYYVYSFLLASTKG
ncbi:MAG: hypothetical protein IPO43_11280 [Rhodoferax sp.]|nr:hypothetical protein [Rhodoferax sp.]